MMKLHSKLNGWDWVDTMAFKGKHCPQKARKGLRRIRKAMARKVRRYLNRFKEDE